MIYFIVVMVLVVFDQWSKNFAAKNLQYKSRQKKGVFLLSYVENRGAALGFLKKHPILLKVLNTSVLALLFAMLIQAKLDGEPMLYIWSLALIIAGGIGNLYDRFKRHYVIDFFSLNIKRMPFFNYADMYVLSGVVMMVISVIFLNVEI